MTKIFFRLLICSVALACFCACSRKVPLDEEQFTALLMDMHKVDGTLAVNRGLRGNDELKNYSYYNDLFKKYGITRADFDSCMFYYSAQTILFSKMYDIILDSLNRQLTAVEKNLNLLKANDSLNYFPIADTLWLDTVYTVNIDSIVPGLYKFNTTLQFDSLSKSRTRRISSYFVSADDKDTLRVRDIIVSIDTLRRTYNWSQYADSTYSRLIINYMEIIPQEQRPKPLKNRKEKKPDIEGKDIDIKEFGGRAWENRLFRPYISRRTENRLKQELRKNNNQ